MKTIKKLSTQGCEACRADVPLLTQEEIISLMSEVEGWKIIFKNLLVYLKLKTTLNHSHLQML